MNYNKIIGSILHFADSTHDVSKRNIGSRNMRIQCVQGRNIQHARFYKWSPFIVIRAKIKSFRIQEIRVSNVSGKFPFEYFVC